jgi:hypothetical protein
MSEIEDYENNSAQHMCRIEEKRMTEHTLVCKSLRVTDSGRVKFKTASGEWKRQESLSVYI